MPHRWNKAANIRRRQIESGKDITFSRVFLPYFESIMESIKPQTFLEVGCGAGHLTQRLSKYKYIKTIHAIDPSADMYKAAKDVLKGFPVSVFNCSLEEYSPSVKYDLIISHLCLQTIRNLDVFLSSVKKLLNESGRFIFSLPHPCFWKNYHNDWFDEYSYMEEQCLEVNLTITKDRCNPICGIPYNHRPLNIYFRDLKNTGLCVLAFDEIFPSTDIQNLYGSPWKEPRYCVYHTILR